jgi:diketogulonate reductase-like aldo/keto reductase
MLYNLNNNKKISQIGFGTWTLHGNTVKNSMKIAYEVGYRLFFFVFLKLGVL